MNETDDTFLFTVLTQLAGQAPVLLAYLVGVILALVFWQRSPVPALLTLIAMVLFLMTTLVQSVLVHYLVRVSADSGMTLGWMLSANAVIGSVLRAMAVGLMLAAVFTGRRSSLHRKPNQALLPTEEHHITNRPRS